MNTENNSTSSYSEQVVSEIISIARQIYKAFPDENDRDYAKTVFLAVMAVSFPEYRR